MLTCFGMIWNHDNFLKQNRTSNKICTLLNFDLFKFFILKNDILRQLYGQ
jgi:hypothetical protein